MISSTGWTKIVSRKTFINMVTTEKVTYLTRAELRASEVELPAASITSMSFENKFFKQSDFYRAFNVVFVDYDRSETILKQHSEGPLPAYVDPQDEHLPKDLDEVVELLNAFWKPEIKFLKDMPEQKFMAQAHHSGGQFLRNSYFLWWFPGHPYVGKWPVVIPHLVQWFNQRQIFHADDMSGIILTTFHRMLLGKDVELSQQIIKYLAHWEKQGFEGGVYKIRGPK